MQLIGHRTLLALKQARRSGVKLTISYLMLWRALLRSVVDFKISTAASAGA